MKQFSLRLDSLPGEAQQQQRWRASQVMAEATVLKKRATELRKLEQRRAMYCVDPTSASSKAILNGPLSLISTRLHEWPIRGACSLARKVGSRVAMIVQ